MKQSFLILFLLSFLVIHAQQPVLSEKGISKLPTANSKLPTSSYAVVIGISDYQDPGIPDLQFADKDALAFANYLRSPAGGSLNADHLKVLINSQATMAQFANVLDWLMESAKEGDQAIIYFSGHGDVEKKTYSQPGFLLCWDAPARVYMAGGAFALPMLQEVISTLSIQNKVKVLMITDACRSGKLAGSGVGGAQITGANLAKQYANEIKILSCQPNEYSIEGTQWGGGRGAFSYHLIDALYGLADSNNDQWVTLQEVSRYLEDHVSNEVAPISQVPMIIGNRTERLSNVDAPMVASIRSGKSNQMAMLASIDSRGLEDDILSKTDSIIRETYRLFKKSLKDKILLDTTEQCAEAYYKKLINEPKLAKLHSAIKRNYAAALQDDAQQVINIWLTADPKRLECIGTTLKLEPIPAQLERATQLLSEGHYMYKALKGRQYFFEAILLRLPIEYKLDTLVGRKCLNLFNKSLEFEPNSPLVNWAKMIIYAKQMGKLDSAQFFLEAAHKLAPAWVLPFHDFYWITTVNRDPVITSLGKAAIDRAMVIDSVHGMVLLAMGDWLVKHHQYEEAQAIYLRYILNGGATYRCWYSNISAFLLEMNKPVQALAFIEKIIKLDSLSEYAPTLLANFYMAAKDYKKAEASLEKYLLLHPDNVDLHYLIGRFLNIEGRLKEAIPHFEFVIKKTPLNMNYNYPVAEIMLGEVLLKLGRKQEAESWFKKVLKVSSNASDQFAFNYIGRAYLDLGMMDEFQSHIKKVNKDKPNDEFIEYQTACLYVLANKQTEALDYLEKSIIHSNSKAYLFYELDFDFDSIYGTEAYNSLMRKYFPERMMK